MTYEELMAITHEELDAMTHEELVVKVEELKEELNKCYNESKQFRDWWYRENETNGMIVNELGTYKNAIRFGLLTLNKNV